MEKLIKDTKGNVFGKAEYKNGVYHGKVIRYYKNSTDVEFEIDYVDGLKHGKCIRYMGSFKYIEYYDNDTLYKKEQIFETDEYLGKITTTFEKLKPGLFVGGYFKDYKENITTVRIHK